MLVNIIIQPHRKKKKSEKNWNCHSCITSKDLTNFFSELNLNSKVGQSQGGKGANLNLFNLLLILRQLQKQ